MGKPATPDEHAEQCYIYAPSIDMKLTFQFMPEEISDSKGANYTETEIVGRSHPIQGYSSSGARTLSFTLQFYQMDADDDPLAMAVDLKSLCYPQYAGSVFPPPPVHVRIGTGIGIWAIMTQCDITYKAPWNANAQPMFVEVSVSFAETGIRAWDVGEIRAFSDTVYLGP